MLQGRSVSIAEDDAEEKLYNPSCAVRGRAYLPWLNCVQTHLKPMDGQTGMKGPGTLTTTSGQLYPYTGYA
ncbi:hypothetical protein G6O67_001253 [Ophiocordyceps sinensis]|uniref:Uncharacterized protein n=1 Tax=Ophiocordyceps sinensis TaxID=72228 RepID=A0A8H4PXA2_9HYPO|nr:hypothetical protein G6O67_001253 [Ophiocordyceps sinensis]